MRANGNTTRCVNVYHFCLYLRIEARTFIKDFVYENLGRTKRNIESLINMTAGNLYLNVKSVDVDWSTALND
jgi:tRNA U54 and U55 pseudouridine synthase Pus10